MGKGEEVGGSCGLGQRQMSGTVKFDLGVVEGDFGEGFEGGGEGGGGLGGREVAPGAYGVEVGEKLGTLLGGGGGGETGGEGFAIKFDREGIGKVLKEDEGDEDAVARGPGAGIVGEDVELEREMAALGVDGGVDARGVAFEGMELDGWELGKDAVGGGAEGEGALEPIVRNEAGAEDFSELAGGVTAEGIHLEEAILSSDETLGEDEIVEGAGVEGGDTAGIAGDGDRGGEAGGNHGAGELGKAFARGGVKPEASGDDRDDKQKDEAEKAGQGEAE